jgi:uncharacterized protein with NAD-binding domain and iron-sulfur cluster
VTSGSRPIRVAIVGGGCAAMAAAVELTRPALAGRYEVTVYQLGWRLGGKGASGRGPAGRIEEHGLHLWMGFYENAFRLMRECYAELGRDPATCPIADWRDAFTPAPVVGVTDRAPGGPWLPWLANLPRTEGLPGDPDASGRRFTVADYLLRSAAMLRALFGSLQSHGDAGPHGDPARSATNAGDGLVERVTQLLRVGELATLTAIIEAVGLLELVLGQLGRQRDGLGDGLVLRLLEALSAAARAHIAARAESDVPLRRLWIIADLTLATMRGIVRFGLVTDPRGFDAIDDYDCREWLRLNGASEPALASGYLAGLYDLGFSYEDADPARPRIAAGQALRSMVRAFFTYRTAFFWRMEAGMGDVVFAPFYEVLRRRGVRFAFFHRLENVGLSQTGAPHVRELQFDVQAFVRSGVYEPLVDVGGLPCWPAEPDWSQLVDGERCRDEGWQYESHWDRRRMATRTLRVGEDFDLVVLAVGLGAVPYVCRELVARDPRWRAMVDNVKTVATQAFQVWLSADMESLGWSGPPPAVSGFVEPFDTWADMRHLIPREAWPAAPKALAYFCNVLPDHPTASPDDPAYPLLQAELVRENALRFLDRDVLHLWPRAARPGGGFRWDLLVAPDDPRHPTPPPDGPGRFASQFWTANVNPTDRYTLSLPGSSAYRISPLDDTYDNLTIAGDWTACGFNAGCVEAAVMSGRLAAHAIAQSPPLDDIVGYDHP